MFWLNAIAIFKICNCACDAQDTVITARAEAKSLCPLRQKGFTLAAKRGGFFQYIAVRICVGAYSFLSVVALFLHRARSTGAFCDIRAAIAIVRKVKICEMDGWHFDP